LCCGSGSVFAIAAEASSKERFEMMIHGDEKYHARSIYIDDVELTCWVGSPPPGMQQEIIEIGLVEMDLQTLEITRERSHFVRPKRWEISERCTKLTGIVSDDIQRARPFPEIVESLTKEFSPSNAVCCAWGDDAGLIASTCQSHALKTPLRNRLDLSQLVQWLFLLKQTPSLRNAVEMFGLDFDGVPHGALVDARNTARGHAAVIRRMRRESDLVAAPMEQIVEVSPITSFGEKLRSALTKEDSRDFSNS
jgi:inhibitor of KinA sporulation pathway (predicted exonuclease)